jgi:Fic family protein
MTDRYPTEQALQNWRHGQPQAERLSADMLTVEGFESVDPQAPLGGPDGLKDALCKKEGHTWVAAAYFPTTLKEYVDVKKKFLHDIEGVGKNKADGVVFFKNQRLSVGERETLTKLAKPSLAEIYHVERMRNILDTPKGFFLRLEYLGISMTPEDQVGLLDEFKDKLSDRFVKQEKAIEGLRQDVATLIAHSAATPANMAKSRSEEQSIESLEQKIDMLTERTMALATNLAALPSSLRDRQSLDSNLGRQYPTSSMTPEQLIWLHRALLSDDDGDVPAGMSGFRRVAVWIGGTSLDKATFTPMPPVMIEVSLSALLARWQAQYPLLLNADKKAIIKALAEFHYDFLKIHPFLDGNGRVARAVLQQQAKELLNKDVRAIFSDDPASYYDALKAANTGDLLPLISLIEVVLE